MFATDGAQIHTDEIQDVSVMEDRVRSSASCTGWKPVLAIYKLRQTLISQQNICVHLCPICGEKFSSLRSAFI